MSRFATRIRRIASTDNHPVFVGLLDATIYFVISLSAVAGTNALRNATTNSGTYTIDYASFAPMLAMTAAICGSVGGVLGHFIRCSLVVRSVPRTIVGTLVAVLGATALTWSFVALVWEPITDPLDLVATTACIGMAAAPFGYRMYGFVPANNVMITINDNPAIPINPGSPETAITADGGTLLSYRPNTDQK